MKKIAKIKINNEQELINIAKNFSDKLNERDIIFLNGELGAGKTTFVKGIAKGLGIFEEVTSPTFSLLKEYDNKLCHIDAYRIYDEDLGVEDYLSKKFIVCVEWSENIENYIDPTYVINIEYIQNGREVEILKV